MFESLFNSNNKERILLYLAAKDEGYAREIARFFGSSLAPIQNQLDLLERGDRLQPYSWPDPVVCL